MLCFGHSVERVCLEFLFFVIFLRVADTGSTFCSFFDMTLQTSVFSRVQFQNSISPFLIPLKILGVGSVPSFSKRLI